IAKGFKQMVQLSIVFGELAVIIGLISGYYMDIPPGGTIVLASIIILLGTMWWKKHSKRIKGGEQVEYN
ncbi:MAG TPA: metal ABC transporter permease, partial [Bacillota bacterium]|nr:metal ABC transporter permease [Bacillota bacterium]